MSIEQARQRVNDHAIDHFRSIYPGQPLSPLLTNVDFKQTLYNPEQELLAKLYAEGLEPTTGPIPEAAWHLAAHRIETQFAEQRKSYQYLSVDSIKVRPSLQWWIPLIVGCLATLFGEQVSEPKKRLSIILDNGYAYIESVDNI